MFLPCLNKVYDDVCCLLKKIIPQGGGGGGGGSRPPPGPSPVGYAPVDGERTGRGVRLFKILSIMIDLFYRI